VVGCALLSRIPGGWSEFLATAGAAGKFTFLNLSPDPKVVYTIWAGIAGGIAITLATHGTDQFFVQRLLSARSKRDAQTGLALSGLVVFVQFALFLVIGAMLFTYYQHVPVPALTRSDEILPRFVIDTLSGGPAGFIIAAIVAAALSPSLNAMAATTVNDFYRAYVRPDAGEATLMRVARTATIVWGIVQIAVAFASQWMGQSVLDAGLSVLSLAPGPVLGAFLVGVSTTSVGDRAMVSGMMIGIAVLAVVWGFGLTAWTWYALIGSTVTATSAWLVSRVVKT
jgi:Na+/proline symporter